jgi:hypothetical protein
MVFKLVQRYFIENDLTKKQFTKLRPKTSLSLKTFIIKPINDLVV